MAGSDSFLVFYDTAIQNVDDTKLQWLLSFDYPGLGRALDSIFVGTPGRTTSLDSSRSRQKAARSSTASALSFGKRLATCRASLVNRVAGRSRISLARLQRIEQ